MHAPILTRYLYIFDETIYSLLYTLITKTSLDECVFWLGEIYYSGYTEYLWRFLWCVYYDFFAIQFPKFEKKFTKLYYQWRDEPNIIYLLRSIQLLYYSPITPSVFYLRMLESNLPNKIYVGRLPKWLKNLNMTKIERNLIRSIHEHNMVNIVYHLRYFKSTPEVAYTAIKRYFRKIHGHTLKDIKLADMLYKEKIHIILATICYLLQDEKDIQKRIVCLKLDKEKYMQVYKQSNQPIQPLYQTLLKQRKYIISDKIGCFALSRFHLSHKDNHQLDHKKILWYHWEYFAYKAPLWRERFDQYKIIIDDKNYHIIFKDIEEEEEFYEKYYYEPDEQAASVQACSLRSIPEIDMALWIAVTFKKKIKEKLNKYIRKEKYHYISWGDEILEETVPRNKLENT